MGNKTTVAVIGGLVILLGAIAAPNVIKDTDEKSAARRQRVAEDSQARAKRARDVEIWEAAKKMVTRELRAPSTAKFPDLPPPRPNGTISIDPDEPHLRNPALSIADDAKWRTPEVRARGFDAEVKVMQDLLRADPRSKDRWEVNGWVDAQNGFGAMLRHHFKVRLIESDGAWVCEGIEFDTP